MLYSESFIDFFYWIVAILPAPRNPQKQALRGRQSDWQLAALKALLYLTSMMARERESPALPSKWVARGQSC